MTKMPRPSAICITKYVYFISCERMIYLKKSVYDQARQKALAIYEKAHIILTEQEKENLEVADFGLGDLEHTGLELVTYVNTERCCAKECALSGTNVSGTTVTRPLRAPRTSAKKKLSVFGLAPAIFMWTAKHPKIPSANRQKAVNRGTPSGTRSCCTPANSIPCIQTHATGFKPDRKVPSFLNSAPKAMMNMIFLPTQTSIACPLLKPNKLKKEGLP